MGYIPGEGSLPGLQKAPSLHVLSEGGGPHVKTSLKPEFLPKFPGPSPRTPGKG